MGHINECDPYHTRTRMANQPGESEQVIRFQSKHVTVSMRSITVRFLSLLVASTLIHGCSTHDKETPYISTPATGDGSSGASAQKTSSSAASTPSAPATPATPAAPVTPAAPPAPAPVTLLNCSTVLSSGQNAQALLAQGHTELDKDKDGKACSGAGDF